LRINENGDFEIYTIAVHVARINKVLNLFPGTDTSCQQDTYYDIADATWVNLQEELEQWILDNGGQANIKQPIAIKVEKEKIIEELTKEETIDQINCD
jgi:plasmid maintenance system antidote protein VapI